jgi:hypothetical protein
MWTVATPDLLPLHKRQYCLVSGVEKFVESVQKAANQVERPDREWVRWNSWWERCTKILHFLQDNKEQDDRKPLGAVPRRVVVPDQFVDYHQVQLRIGWACTARCNAKPVCPYCCTDVHRGEYGSAFCRPPSDILDGFSQITRDYGPFYLVSGWGDGMADDEVASLLGQMALANRVDITSNVVFPKGRLDLLPRNRNVNFCLSFHPHLWKGDVKPFIQKADWLREQGFPIAVVGVVAYPPTFRRLAGWLKELKAADLVTNCIPFGGQYNGRKYPEAYTAKQWEFLLPQSCEKSAQDEHAQYATRTGSPRGKKCLTGCPGTYIYIDWHGRAKRCVVVQDDEDGSLGDIFSGIKLWTEPRPCAADQCTCTDLWQYVEG